MEIHREGKIAFGKGVFELSDLSTLIRNGEGNEVKIRVGTGGPFHTGPVGPHGDAGKEPAQERGQLIELIFGEIYRIGHSHVVPVIV